MWSSELISIQDDERSLKTRTEFSEIEAFNPLINSDINWMYKPQINIARKSSYLKSSYKCTKEPPNTMKLSLEIYGVRKNISRQNTLLKLITDG
jgi:hypothetical protein